jgi:hypothetical protein
MESHEDFDAAGRGDFVAFYFGFGGQGLRQKKAMPLAGRSPITAASGNHGIGYAVNQGKGREEKGP